MEIISKSDKIKNTMKVTRERRENQLCKTFTLKIVKSKLNKQTKKALPLYFLEAKWLQNHIISQPDIFSVSDKLTEVDVMINKLRIGNEEEEETKIGIFVKRKLTVLGSQVKQSIIRQTQDDIRNLSKKKEKGYKVGRLKYKSKVQSVTLKQFGNTYRLDGNYLKIQGIDQWLYVKGVSQLSETINGVLYNYEIAVGKLVQKAGDFYLHVTCYMDRKVHTGMFNARNEARNKPIINKQFMVAPDFGVLNQITLSNRIQLNYQIPVTDKFKWLCKQLSHKVYGSRNYWKALTKVQKQYRKFNNQKHDIKNKIKHILLDEFEHVAYQNDCMQGWQKLWGRRMLNTAIGGIIADFRSLKESGTTIEVSRYFPSTKQCRECGHKQHVSLDERVFMCDACQHTEPRDLHSALSILEQAYHIIGAEYTEYKPVETNTDTFRILDRFNSVAHLKASMVFDAGSLAALAAG